MELQWYSQKIDALDTKMNKLLNLKTLNVILAIFFLLLILFFTRFEPTSWNDRSRFSNIKSLVDYHTLSIDSEFFNTGDKIFANNHFYSDKPPMLAVVASAPYAFFHIFDILFKNHPRFFVYITSIFTLTFPLIIYLFLLYKNTLKNTKEGKKNIILFYILTITASTVLLPYTSHLNNHLPASIFVGIGIILLLYNKISKINSFIVGLLLGFASTFDLSVCFISFFICIFYLILLNLDKKIKLKQKLIFFLSLGVGLLIPFFTHLFINMQITGDIFPGSMHPEFFNYPGSPFTTNNLTGATFAVSSFKDWLGHLFYMTFGYRGFFIHNPTILFGIFIAFYYAIKEKNIKWKYYSITALLGTLTIILYYSLYGKGGGGSSYTIRWFIVFITLYIPIILRWVLNTKKINLKIFNILLIISIFINILAMGSAFSSVNNIKKFHFINMYYKFPVRVQKQKTQFPKLIFNKYEDNYNNTNL